MYQNAHLGGAFRNNLAFFAIDLDQLMREQSPRIRALLRQLAARIPQAAGPAAVAAEAYSIDQVEEALQVHGEALVTPWW